MKEIDKYMSPVEAAERWGKKVDTVKARLRFDYYGDKLDDMIDRGLIKYYKKPGGKNRDWIISTHAMREWFGDKNK
jgi:hypothetical protein